MSGHSKWAQIKRQKGTADQKRGVLFTKLSRGITVAAREGGENTEFNFKLRLAIDQARASNMPKESIEKAIARGLGKTDEGELEQITYEGYGPGGIAIMIQATTDNRNRTTAAIRHLLTEYSGRLGEKNSVMWMFDQRGVLRMQNEKCKMKNYREEVELAAIDSGALDIESDGENEITIYTKPEELQRIKEELERAGYSIEYAETEPFAKNTIELEPENQKKLDKLFEALDEQEDIQDYYTNAK